MHIVQAVRLLSQVVVWCVYGCGCVSCYSCICVFIQNTCKIFLNSDNKFSAALG